MMFSLIIDVVFGESVGAMSIGSLLVADRGKAVEKLGLFRGAIMESGAPFGYKSPLSVLRAPCLNSSFRISAMACHPLRN